MRLNYFLNGNYRGNLLHMYAESYCNVVPCPAAKICGRNEKFLDTKAGSSLCSGADINTTTSY